MGYYSSFEWLDLEYRDKIGLITFVMQHQEKKSYKTDAEGFFSSVVLVGYKIDKTNIQPLQKTVPANWFLEWSEHEEGKWYCQDEWVKWIAPFIKSGIMRFKGEDGEVWGWRFMNGNVKAIEYGMVEVEDIE